MPRMSWVPIVEVGEQTVTTDGNNVIINSDVTYENKTADVELIANSKTKRIREHGFQHQLHHG